MNKSILSLLALSFILLAGCQTAPPPPPDPAAELQPIFDQFVEAWNTGNLDLLDPILAADFKRITPSTAPTSVNSPEEMKQIVTMLRTGYPDLNVRIDEVIYTPGKSAARWTFTGTNTGDLEDQPATGKAVEFSGISISHYENGKVTREWLQYDNLDFWQQLGATLTPPGAESQP